MPYLSLVPSEQAVRRRLAGFHSGTTLKLFFKSGETLHTVLHRFNEYRSPENQITAVFAGPELTRQVPDVVLQADSSVWIP